MAAASNAALSAVLTCWMFCFREENLPTGTVEWSPAVHRLCSRLARQQVMVLLLLMRRVERSYGYPFPKEIKARHIPMVACVCAC